VIIAKQRIRAEDVNAITVMIPTMYSYVMEQGRGGKFPRNYAEAQNDLPYVTAAMVVHEGVFVETFERRVLEDPLMKEVAAKVRVEIDPSMDEVFRGTDKAPATVTVLLRTGGVYGNSRIPERLAPESGDPGGDRGKICPPRLACIRRI
jgi:2-methylcitrate dehydratase PrpD